MNAKDLRALLRRRFNIPKERAVRRTINSFTHAERVVFYFFTTIFILTGIILLWNVSSAYLVKVPTDGGSLTEGVVGNPRFINPVLALSEADKNLTALIYSGLVRVDTDGSIKHDLASDLVISEDERTYTVTISDEARFHDGTPVTADDVVFTITKIRDLIIKSPKRGNWEGVTIEKIDNKTIEFSLKQNYEPFMYNLATGILPKHIWKNVNDDEFSFSQFNSLPIGSGPYKVQKVERNSGGIPDYYELAPYEDSLSGKPYIKSLVFRFYPSEQELINAYNNGDIESIGGISPNKLPLLNTGNSQIIQSPLPRIFAVFFNQNRSKTLAQREVRQALEISAPKDKIVNEILSGYATAIDSPLPASVYPWAIDSTSSSTEDRIDQAKKILNKAGWKINPTTGTLEKSINKDIITLSFTISTGDAPELKSIAEKLKSTWEELGAKVEVLAFQSGELNQAVIRPRQFDALLFGEVVGRDADLYPFWHSSQRNDPGLNIALYTNSKTDKFLDLARTSSNRAAVEAAYKSFSDEINKDIPAVFLYSPNFVYILPEKLKDVRLGSLAVPQDRFLGVVNWYVETDRVWEIFLNSDV